MSRIQAIDRSTVSAIGGGPNSCNAKYVISYTSGAEWEARSQRLQGSWYRTPRNRNEVRASTGGRSTPCESEVIDLAVMDDQNAAVLCAGGSVRSSEDAGNTWDELGTLPDGLVLGADSDHYVAAGGDEDCEGVTVTIFSATEQPNAADSGCASEAEASAGTLALAVRGETVWLWSGSQLAVSEYSGQSW